MRDLSHLEYADAQVIASWEMLQTAKRILSPGAEGVSAAFFPANAISECQQAIELSVKSMFRTVEEDHPRSHGIEMASGQVAALLQSDVIDDFDRASEIPRAIFLTKVWHQFYEQAKYGHPEQNIRPDDIVRKSDAERAIGDAEFCVRLASDLLNKEAKEEGMEPYGLAAHPVTEEEDTR